MFLPDTSSRGGFRAPPRISHSSRAISSLIALQLIVALQLGFCPAAVGASLSDVPDSTYVTDGQVNAIVRVGNTIYIGGDFGRVGPRSGPGVEIALDGSVTAGLPEISGVSPGYAGFSGAGLRAVIADGAGGWYVGGLFSHVGGLARRNVTHILADHSVDPGFSASIDGNIDALALSGTTLYVAGSFTTINGQTRNNIGALDTTDGSVKTFDPNANNEVVSLALSNDGSILYAGGFGFTTIGGQPRAAIAALNTADGAATSTFNPSANGPNGFAILDVMVISGSTLYVGGTFNVIGGAARTNIAALSLGGANDGVAVPSFDPSPSLVGCPACSQINALAVSGSTIYAGGIFDTIGGQTRNHIAGLNTADGTATAFDPSSSSNISSLAVSGSIVYAGGGFTSIGGQPRNYMAALNAADGSATAFDPSPNNIVLTIGVSGSAIYLGGYFSSLGGVVRNRLAAINVADGTPTAWDPNPSEASISALAVSGSTLYVGGYFTAIGGQPRSNIAAISIADGSATNWNPGADDGVYAIALSGNLVYVGGSFLNVGGQQRTYLAALNAADGTATPWNPSPDGTVQAIGVSGALVYVGGYFVNIGGQPRVVLAALNTSDGSAASWNPNLGPGLYGTHVYALVVSGSTIYAGGGFSSVNGITRNNIAGINASDGTPTSFDPNASDPTGSSDGGVSALALDVNGTTVYAGGYFGVIGGQPRGLLAALNVSDGSAASFDPSAPTAVGWTVSALTVGTDGSLYAGGSFPTFAFASAQGLAVFTNDVVFHNGFEGP
jgi:hypothetical protein